MILSQVFPLRWWSWTWLWEKGVFFRTTGSYLSWSLPDESHSSNVWHAGFHRALPASHGCLAIANENKRLGGVSCLSVMTRICRVTALESLTYLCAYAAHILLTNKQVHFLFFCSAGVSLALPGTFGIVLWQQYDKLCKLVMKIHSWWLTRPWLWSADDTNR